MSRFLMCAPDHYGIEYEINPWMDRRVQPDRGMARLQWDALVGILEGDLRATVECIDGAPGLPDMVFTANAGYVEGDVFIPSRFRYRARLGEEPYFRSWFRRRGYVTREIAGEWSFEGFGDALPVGKRLFAGYRFRSDIQAHTALGEILGREVISLELVDSRFYHLDTCFCPLGRGEVVYFPDAFDEYARRALEGILGRNLLIPVGAEEARTFCCNAVALADAIVMNTGAPTLGRMLRERKYRVYETDLSEFVKSGGSAKCLTCRLS